jgi:hypothetical protein
MIGYKLFRVRKNGTLGTLFIDCKRQLISGVEYPALDIPTKGYKYRPGWHICRQPYAPHLSTRGRHWFRVEFFNFDTLERPESQGGIWYIAREIIIHNMVGDPR